MEPFIYPHQEVNVFIIRRLINQRQEWRSDHPFGFVAKPMINYDGSLNLLKWKCVIPGPKGSPWEGGIYSLTMDFSNDYPVRPPKCVFNPVPPHLNVYPSGTVQLSILNDEDWKPQFSIATVLQGIQDLLLNPNTDKPAQKNPYIQFKMYKRQYVKNAKDFASKNNKYPE